MNNSIQRLMPAVTLVFLMLRCSGLEPITSLGGGASETIAVAVIDSTVSGRISAATTSGDFAVQGATVKLFDDKYLPFFPCSTNNFYDSAISGASGEFRFSGIRPGSYNLYVRNASFGRSAFISGIPVCSGGDTLYDTLTSPGAVSGRVFTITKSNDTLAAPRCNVFILGTQFVSTTDATGAFVLSGLPQGSYTLLGVTDSMLAAISDSKGSNTKIDSANSNNGKVVTTVKPGETLAGKILYLKP